MLRKYIVVHGFQCSYRVDFVLHPVISAVQGQADGTVISAVQGQAAGTVTGLCVLYIVSLPGYQVYDVGTVISNQGTDLYPIYMHCLWSVDKHKTANITRLHVKLYHNNQ